MYGLANFARLTTIGMEIATKYNPADVEDKLYAKWLEKGYFNSVPDDREPYTIVIPPPNVTGVLHMGHMLNNTIQDVLIRRARMLGYNACWVPGTDHASIATEAKVVNKLRDEGIKKSDLSRDEFLQHAWDWKEKHGGIILEQLKKLGASCDWERTSFTMDRLYSESVLNVFIDLFEKGHIYRGKRMINWDPKALTALSDEEVNYKEVNSQLFHVRYKVEDSEDEWVTIATTRPETILGDTAVCVNPDDDRYKKLHNKRVIVPLANRSVPIIADDYVAMDFGTGCLKVTPAHDVNDHVLGQKHNLDVIDIFNENGTLNDDAGMFVGEDRFIVRKKIVKELNDQGYLVKVEDHVNKVGFSERTDEVIEPRLSLQWFVSMKKLSKPALENVLNDTIRFYPENTKNTYRHWMENIKDWCISRQLWWGHRIPAWYYGKEADDFIVARNGEEALKMAQSKSGNQALTMADLKQDEDVLDTWFSSWLWPMAVFNGVLEPDNEEINYYYPTNDLVTAPEIMFFWVARMIISGYEYRDEKPFSNVYYTGIVRDKLRRKMSKSLGNSPDPLELMAKYGADGVRVGMLLCSPAGNDLLFDSSLCEQGRNFTNKIWNAFRLVKSWSSVNEPQPEDCAIAAKWFENRLNQAIAELNDSYSKFRISEVLMTTYKLVWDDFCSWYLEMIKPGFEQPIDSSTLEATIGYFDTVLKLMHPFTPFVSEQIYQNIKDRSDDDSIVIATWPEAGEVDTKLASSFNQMAEVVTGVRNIRKQKNIPNKVAIELLVRQGEETDTRFDAVISKLCHVSLFKYVDEKPGQAISLVIGRNEYFVPYSDNIDVDAEKKKIMDELNYTKGFLTSVQKKLANERFVSSAPEQVVESERKKEADALAKIVALEEQLAGLS